MDLNAYFKIKEKGSSVRTEIMAGVTTFMTMAYILAVNPAILSATGMDIGSVFAATAISSESILNCIPIALKKAISAGIGLFIAFIGLQASGIVVKHPATLVAMGDIASPQGFVAVIGLLAASIMLVRKIKGALLYSILFATFVGAFMGVTKIDEISFSSFFSLPNVAPTFWQFDFSQILSMDTVIILSTLLFVDLFDTVGTLIGVATKGNMLDEQGRLPQAKQAFFADAIGSIAAAVFGTSAVTSFVESASGVAAGGRTCLAAPLFILIPSAATAPTLIIVGLFMISSLKDVDFDDYALSIPMFVTIIGIPLTYSIAHGIAWGIISYVFIFLLIGRIREVHPLAAILAIIFIIKFMFE